MKFFDLFSGIGGFRLGLERAGHVCVGSCEIDKYARQIYKTRFGEIPEYDVRDLHAERLPKFDILTGGFPCQAFSIAGKRMGFDDTRGTLFFEIARIAKETRPKFLFLENVKGLLNHDSGRTFGTIIYTLYELGYDIEWQVINGKYFVPQHRERIFIIATLRDRCTRKILPLRENFEIPDRQVSGKEKLPPTLCNTIDSTYYKGGHGTSIQVLIQGSQCNRVHEITGISPTIPTQCGGRTIPMFLMSHTESHMKERIQMRNASWTLDTSGRKQAVQQGYRVRKLTPLECERLMGFPDYWTDVGISDTQRYKCLGNSVIVPIIERIGKELR